MVNAAAWLASPRDATPALLAAYAARVGRPFPSGLLPDGPLRRVGPRGLPARLHAALAAAWHRDPCLRGVDLMFGSAATCRPLIPFSLAQLRERAPIGYFAAGFAARPLGELRFHYARRDAWNLVLFRFPATGSCAARIAPFLAAFAEFRRALRARAASFIAVEKDGYSAHYEVTTAQRTIAFDRPRFTDPDFSHLIEAASS